MHDDFNLSDINEISIVPSSIAGKDITHVLVDLNNNTRYGGAFETNSVLLDLADCLSNLERIGN